MTARDLFPGWAERRTNTQGVESAVRSGGSGPPLLLLHGYLGRRGAEPLQVRDACGDLSGAEIGSGHFLADETPRARPAAVLPFMAAHGVWQ